MNQAWKEFDEHEQWSLQADELRLLPGMTDKGRLGCALQLKFRQIHGRYPERLDEIDPTAARSVAEQVGVSLSTLSTYDLDSRQGQRHRRTIRDFLGYRLFKSCFSIARLRLRRCSFYSIHTLCGMAPTPESCQSSLRKIAKTVLRLSHLLGSVNPVAAKQAPTCLVNQLRIHLLKTQFVPAQTRIARQTPQHIADSPPQCPVAFSQRRR